MCKVPRRSLDVPLLSACSLALGITLIPPARTQASCGFSFHIPKWSYGNHIVSSTLCNRGSSFLEYIFESYSSSLPLACRTEAQVLAIPWRAQKTFFLHLELSNPHSPQVISSEGTFPKRKIWKAGATAFMLRVMGMDFHGMQREELLGQNIIFFECMTEVIHLGPMVLHLKEVFNRSIHAGCKAIEHTWYKQ